jgi:hypothetical protein
MKKGLLLFILTLSSSFVGFSQGFITNPYGLSRPPIAGSSPFQDSLWAIDTNAYNIVLRHGPVLPGFTITGMTGLTMHPHTGEHFIIMKLSAVSGRVLGKINLLTGVCTQIGNLGANYSTITFREDGQLVGATGNGATPPETMFLIDQATGVTTLAYAMGNGADGEILAYNYDDNSYYHWSGNGTMVMEKMLATDLTYTPTNIVTSGLSTGETFGAVYLGNGNFMISNISSQWKKVTSNGAYGPVLASTPDDMRGLALTARWIAGPTVETTAICANDSVMLQALATNNDGNRHKFQWVLNGVNIPGATNDIFYANQSGRYNCRIILDSLFTNNQTMDSVITAYTDTAWFGRSIIVNPLPVLNLSPSPNANFCTVGDSVQLMTDSFVVMQWYRDGAMIPSATDSSFYASIPGSYNMMVTDANGCSDTSAVPTSVLLSPSPSLSNTSNTCFGDSVLFIANTGSAQYNWLLNGTSVAISGTNTFYANAGGNYSVETTFGSCVDTSASTAITFAPQYDVTPNGSGSICIGSNQLLTATAGGSGYQWLLNGTAIGGATSQTFTATATGAYECIVTFPGCTDTTISQYSLTAVDCSGIEENETTMISVYPNPVHVQLTIATSNNTIIEKVEVVDLSGRKVISTNTNSANVSLNVETLRAGSYLISITTENGIKTKRFIKN